jgi:hypothetical protein
VPSPRAPPAAQASARASAGSASRPRAERSESVGG